MCSFSYNNNHKSPLKCCHVTCQTLPLMTSPIFHRVFLSVCPDTQLLEASACFTSSAPRHCLITSSSHIYKYQPAKKHFLSPTPCLARTGRFVTWQGTCSPMERNVLELSSPLRQHHPPDNSCLKKQKNPSVPAFDFKSDFSLFSRGANGLYKIIINYIAGVGQTA